jgi:XTP/dITP diphosphohydrolase
MDTVRKVESAIAAARRADDVPEELDVAHLGVVSADEWREYWPGSAFEDALVAEVSEDAGVAEPPPPDEEAPESEPTPEVLELQEDSVNSSQEVPDGESPEAEAESGPVARND